MPEPTYNPAIHRWVLGFNIIYRPMLDPLVLVVDPDGPGHGFDSHNLLLDGPPPPDQQVPDNIDAIQGEIDAEYANIVSRTLHLTRPLQARGNFAIINCVIWADYDVQAIAQEAATR